METETDISAPLAALEGELPPLPAVHLHTRLLEEAPQLLRLLPHAPKRVALVCDMRTHHAAGERLQHALAGDYSCTQLLLQDPVHPTPAQVEHVRLVARKADLLIAAGSGTINDICKYAAFLEEKPYIACATALSMNGYASATSSLLIDGHKRSVAARAPVALWMDLDVLAQAPRRLTQSGVGDLLCRPAAQADWWLSHRLLGTHYDLRPFALLRPLEAPLRDALPGLLRGDLQAARLLATALVLSGIGMMLAGGSHPASQGEHMIAHTMEMCHTDALPQTFHGEQIGVTTLTMAHIQAEITAHATPPWLKVLPDWRERIESYFGPGLAVEIAAEYRQKLDAAGDVEAFNHRIAEGWEGLKAELAPMMQPVSELEATMRALGAPTTAEALGWRDADYTAALQHAHLSRNRFTFLDL